MVNGDGYENGNKINRSNQQKKKKKPTKKRKKKFAGAAHLFVHFFAVVLHDYNAIVLND